MRAVGIIFSNIHDKNVPELVRVRTLASIPFCGRYRLIDFPLSNMVNSGIDTVGIITKNNYQSLMDHVGSGKDWDLARKNGGLIILPPFGVEENTSLYTSRLEALKGITSFINRADEEYVVMSDCDSVCRLNYNDIIDEHIAKKADVSMVYVKHKATQMEEHNVTTLEIDNSGRIKAFSYKPTLNTDANMAINVFVMKKRLLQNIVLESISHNYKHFTADFLDKNIDSLKIVAFEHKGYYAGISSLQAYYIHNLELLNEDARHELFGDRSVYTKIRDSAPTRFGASAVISNSLIADGCDIQGEVENSILFRGVKVGRGTVVKNCILMQDTVVEENATLNCIITDKNTVVRDRRVLSGSLNHPFYISKGTMI